MYFSGEVLYGVLLVSKLGRMQFYYIVSQLYNEVVSYIMRSVCFEVGQLYHEVGQLYHEVGQLYLEVGPL